MCPRSFMKCHSIASLIGGVGSQSSVAAHISSFLHVVCESILFFVVGKLCLVLIVKVYAYMNNDRVECQAMHQGVYRSS